MLKRCVVIDVGEGLIELVNPEIVSSEGEMVNAEGCLSVPGRRGTVKRPERVTVRAQDRKGRPIEVKGEGFLTMALCHEIDHLDGIIYVDKMIEDDSRALRVPSLKALLDAGLWGRGRLYPAPTAPWGAATSWLPAR